MRRSLILAVAVAAAACGPTRQWVDVEVDWTFAGRSCSAAGVASIQIDVENEALSRNKFTCAEADVGVDIGQFVTGPYTMTVTGFDAAGNLTHQTTARVDVTPGGRNVIPFDAASVTGDAVLRWSFAGKGCDAAGVSTVRVSLDNQVITDAHNSPDLSCKQTDAGALVEGTTIGPLSPGSHTFALAAHGAGADYQLDNLNFTIVAGQDTALAANLLVATPTTASADVRWNFQPGGKTCADVGADHLYVVFDPAADGSGGTVVADTSCAGLGGRPVGELQIVDVPDGNHSFAVRATRQNQLIGYTHRPVATLFTAPFTTAVDVTVEPTP